jgi:hypothetical protein
MPTALRSGGKLKEIAMHDQMMGVWGWVGYAAMVLFFSVGANAVMLWVKSCWKRVGLQVVRQNQLLRS